VAALSQIAHAVNRSLDSDEVLRLAAETVATTLSVDGVIIRTLDPPTGKLAIAAHTGVSGAFVDELGVLDFGQGLAGHVVLTNEPLVVDDARDDPRLGWAVARREALRSVAVVPVHARTSLVATMATFNRSPRHFRADDLSLLQTIADQIGVALENARLYEAEQRRAAELERLNHLKADFVQMVSHELRTPMTVVKTAFDALTRDWSRLPEERRLEYVRVGHTGATRLKGLLENLLLVSAIEDGGVQIRLGAVSIGSVIEGVAREARGRQGRVVETELAPALPAVRADAARLTDVMSSLVENALRYSQAPSPVRISAAQRNGAVVLAVTDQGIGIAPHDMPRLFQRFERIDRTVRSHTGTGLGLYISRRLVEIMGGRIWAESAPGAGSSFYVELAVVHSPGV
jgi:signal transduction histidine kinase